MTTTQQIPPKAATSSETSFEKREGEPMHYTESIFVDDEMVVGSIVKASWVPGSETIAHGRGVSYAGELPKIAMPQTVELTEFHNRPA